MNVGGLKRGLIGALRPLGAYKLTNFLTRYSPRIFMYHRFSETAHPRKLSAESFRRQVTSIASSYQVVSLADLYQQIDSNGRPKKHTAVITIDDGYQDFVDVALPILEEFQLPSTLFVSTRFADGDFWLWPDKLEFALFATDATKLSIDGHEWPIQKDSDKWRCFGALCDRFTHIDHAQKEAEIESLLKQLEVSLPPSPNDEFRGASWETLRSLPARGVEIGGHTCTHPVLSRIQPNHLADEIAGCKRIIEQHLGKPITTFCYPNGQPEDINEAVRSATRDSGFDCAVAAYFQHDVLSDGFEIKRYSGGEDHAQFVRNLMGVEFFSSWLKARTGL